MQINSITFKKLILLVFLGVVFYWCGHYISTILNFIKYIYYIVFPLILGGCIAFVINVLLRVIEGKWSDKLIKDKPTLVRGVSTVLAYSIIFLSLIIMLFVVVPEISRSIMTIGSKLPEYMNSLNITVNSLLDKVNLHQIEAPLSKIDWSKVGESITSFISNSGSTFVSQTLNVTSSIISVIVNLGLAFVFSVYILLSKEKLAKQMKLILYAFLNKGAVNKIMDIGTKANTIFSNFVKGQLLEAIIIGILCFIGMKIFNWPYATMISTLVGFTSLIPVLGAFLGTAVGAFLILLINPMSALWFIIYIIVIQQIDGNFIYPKVVGKSVGLPGMWVLAAVTIGGSINGVFGMLIGVPLFSLLYAILKETVYKNIKEKNIKIETIS